MRTSREWIDQTLAELEAPQAAAGRPRSVTASRRAAADRLTFEIILSEAELEALDAICQEDELSPKQALAQIIRARLLGQPQFARADRARLRACLELLRAVEQHVGRVARPAAALERTALGREALIEELLELGSYLRRVGRAIGETMLGNLAYWRGDLPEQAATPEERAPVQEGWAPSVGGNFD